MADQSAKRVIIEGIVQGVGFRPFVYRLAQAFSANGYVSNVGGAVEVVAACGDMDGFLRAIREQAPPAAHIERLETYPAEAPANGFEIRQSGQTPRLRFLSPDLSVCDNCLREIFDPRNRRRGHFFCSCTNCGPRFTIIQDLPYDRAATTMSPHKLCPACESEYKSPQNPRFHAETICCNSCGVKLLWRGDKKRQGERALRAAVQALQGGIVAIKGIGGCHLACSPFDEPAVAALRRLKRREAKPLAVMFRDTQTAAAYCDLSESDTKLLNSPEKPITIVPAKQSQFAPSLLNGDARVGAFLPYTPLHALLLQQLPAMALTSANPSGGAIITDDGEITKMYKSSAEPLFRGVLYNDRKIQRSAEDSVAQTNLSAPQILRRSRGLAPAPIKIGGGGQILAVGGDLKAAFCLTNNGQAYQSQYFGDLQDESVLRHFVSAYADLSALLNITPTHAVCDEHPSYISAAFAESLRLPLLKVQHHHAHAASVMAEHGLSRAIAVCFDGTGYGDDGAIWGGEFLLADKAGYSRLAHLGYVTLVGGDSAARDAQKTAKCYLLSAEHTDAALSPAIKHRINANDYSSAGRLFDAVSSILGICHANVYEGQCAIALQQAAERAAAPPPPLEFEIARQSGRLIINQQRFVSDLCDLHKKGENPEALALSFHIALAKAVAAVCQSLSRETGVTDVALSGGAFQNTLLTRLCYEKLKAANLAVHINRRVPPNDNGLAVGQAWVAINRFSG